MSLKPLNFSWLIEGKLAGSANIFSEENLKWLRDSGIKAILSLTEHSQNSSILKRYGFEHLHVPIEDYSAPTIDQIEQSVNFIHRMEVAGKPTLVHCGAGRGRTGVILAAYLVYKGYTAEQAVLEVRERRPLSIDTADQEYVIARYERVLESRKNESYKTYRPDSL